MSDSKESISLPRKATRHQWRAIRDFILRRTITWILTLMVFGNARNKAGAATSPFNDANWVSLGGMPGADGAVNAIVREPSSGTLYIGGAFNVIGSTIGAG